MADRITAMKERGHYLLTVWKTIDHREHGTATFRSASGTLSATGEYLEIPQTSSSETYVYPPLTPQLSIQETFDTIVPTLSVSIFWHLATDVDPIDVDLSNAVAQVDWIWESSGGTAVSNWESREPRLYGRVRSPKWGTRYETLQFNIEPEDLSDDGDFYDTNAEISESRYSDVGNSGERDRAPQSDGTLPTILIAPDESPDHVSVSSSRG